MRKPKWFHNGTILQVACWLASVAWGLAACAADSHADAKADVALGLLFVVVAAVFRIEEAVEKAGRAPLDSIELAAAVNDGQLHIDRRS